MAVLLPKSIYVHLMKTGGWSVRHAISRMKLHMGEIGRGHDPASLLPLAARNNRFTFVFIRNPLMWYRSYWAYRMQVNWIIVHQKQPITGWQTFGSVLDFECRAYQFEIWLRNVLEFVPEGFLSRIYRIYTEGVDYVGRVESLTQDLSQALTLAGENFSPNLLDELPKRNVTNSRFTDVATVPKELAERVMMAESYIVDRWGYNSIPTKLLNNGGNEYVRMQFSIEEHGKLLNNAVRSTYSYPSGMEGKGIVICGGGLKFFPGAWVCINMLRRLGCKLPIQLWYLGQAEMTNEMSDLVTPLNVELVDAYQMREKYPARILNGWELKPYSIIHSRFQEVLLLDADNVPIVNPQYLFDLPQYKSSGSIFWPDETGLKRENAIWSIAKIPFHNEPSFDSGQILINKKDCWKALHVTMHMNEYSDFYYQYLSGDKDTFRIAFQKLGQLYSMPTQRVHSLDFTLCQRDFDGRTIFQHRRDDKWCSTPEQQKITGFQFEAECLEYIEELKQKWSGRLF
jgi:hypothetical protein